MAKIISTSTKRRMVKINTDDILNIIGQYQRLTSGTKTYEQIRQILDSNDFYLPEDV